MPAPKPAKGRPPKAPPAEAAERAPRRPDLRVVAKKRDGSVFVPLATFWLDEDTGYFRGGLDRLVKGITVIMADDTRHSIAAGQGSAFYVNAYKGKASDGDDIPF